MNPLPPRLEPPPPDWPAWRIRLHVIIFGHETPAGKAFDVALIVSILASVAAVMLDSIPAINARYGLMFYAIEWFFTALFTVEYVLRLVTAARPVTYARSFFGIVDLASILPTYISTFVPGAQHLQVVRVLRVLRVFRILKLAEYIGEADVLLTAIKASRRKLSIFIATVLVLAIILGTSIYIVEGRTNGFTSIPQSIYWTIVTITTVGYGDIAPATPLGKALASVIMLLGYAIVAVPTGIVTVELTRSRQAGRPPCPGCGTTDHETDAAFCRRCGTRLALPATPRQNTAAAP